MCLFIFSLFLYIFFFFAFYVSPPLRVSAATTVVVKITYISTYIVHVRTYYTYTYTTLHHHHHLFSTTSSCAAIAVKSTALPNHTCSPLPIYCLTLQ
ncbi:hypothetical protein F5X98DRAFT_352834 [Xylaria grammica]|nr:hypothetical protein F5X98DRAFT_352834 [Xylaria grammica]